MIFPTTFFFIYKTSIFEDLLRKKNRNNLDFYTKFRFNSRLALLRLSRKEYVKEVMVKIEGKGSTCNVSRQSKAHLLLMMTVCRITPRKSPGETNHNPFPYQFDCLQSRTMQYDDVFHKFLLDYPVFCKIVSSLLAFWLRSHVPLLPGCIMSNMIVRQLYFQLQCNRRMKTQQIPLLLVRKLQVLHHNMTPSSWNGHAGPSPKPREHYQFNEQTYI